MAEYQTYGEVDGNATSWEWNVTSNASSSRWRWDWPAWKHQMAAAVVYLPPAVLVFIMLATGCSVTLRGLWNHIRHPAGMAIGAASQFILLPLASFGLAHVLELSTPQALGFLISACSPGGGVSNIFTYYMDGDLSLSICMTVASTILALGMMPLNLFIYSRSWTSDSVVIPYDKIAISLAIILLPLMVGMLIRWKHEKVSQMITKVGGFLGMAMITVFLILQALLHPIIFTSWWQVWAASVSLPFVGYLLGFTLAAICRRKSFQSRTIAVETGSQNMGVAITVVVLSYKGEFAAEASVIPLLVAFTVVGGGLCCIMLYMLYLFCGGVCHKENADKHEVQGLMGKSQTETIESGV